MALETSSTDGIGCFVGVGAQGPDRTLTIGIGVFRARAMTRLTPFICSGCSFIGRNGMPVLHITFISLLMALHAGFGACKLPAICIGQGCAPKKQTHGQETGCA
jgi:hypothetical protein